MRKLILFLTSCFLLVPFAANAQITTEELPPSFYESSLSRIKASNFIELAAPNLSSLHKEDALEDPIKSIPWRFGTALEVQLNLQEYGKSFTDNNGNTIWQLGIKAEDALSINLNFEDFNLSANAQLFIYNTSYSDVIGALNSDNNKTEGQFSCRPIQGDQIILELIAPTKEFSENRISIHEVVYGYRSLRDKVAKVFQSSRSCNVNVNCEEGDDWQDQKRSIAMITTSSNTRFCTGVLVNNVRQDSTPYLLTGAHCNVAGNAIFIFGYESDKCDPNTDGILTNSVSGASTKAASTSGFTDFELLELSSRPPLSYNVFYSGWSSLNVAAQSAVCIHHPSGDVMKISHDLDSAKGGYYNNSRDENHWVTGNWEKGTTEGGSSGAPLYNQDQRIVGLLNGGDAACGNTASDFFGKIAISWDTKSDTTQQLKYWLDPDTTGAVVLDGLAIYSADNDKDLHLINISNIPQFICDTSITPVVKVRNIGNDTIFSIDVIYDVDNGMSSTYTESGTFLRNELAEITLPVLNLSSDTHLLNVSAYIGGSVAEDDSTNNQLSYNFQAAANTQNITVEVKTDNFGEESSWRMYDVNSGRELYAGGPYRSVLGGRISINTYCVADSSCFFIDLLDAEDDGFNGSFGNGYLLVKDQNGDTLIFEDDFTTGYKRNTFCLNDTFTNIREKSLEESILSVYPNPVERGMMLQIDSNQETQFYSLLDATGRLMSSGTTSSVQIPHEISPGIYFLQLQSQNGITIAVQKVMVK